jgi:hypothetical protein
MKRTWKNTTTARVAITLAASIIAIPSLFPQVRNLSQQVPALPPQAQSVDEKLQQVISDKAAYATSIMRRWEDAAKANGRWYDNYTTDLYNVLISLQPETLLAAGEASTYNRMLTVVATSSKAQLLSPQDKIPAILGDRSDDLVYTPINPCRIVDTRNAGGPISANSTRSFEVDVASGGNYVAQGGSNTDCLIPNDSVNAVTAAAATITVTQASDVGYLTAWAVGFQQPFASVINYKAGDTLANTTILPVNPGLGTDINVFAGAAGTHVVIDVVGYFAAPLATALNCTTVNTGYVSIAVNTPTFVDAHCPANTTATGGGFDSNEGSLGFPGVWIQGSFPGTAGGFNGWRILVDNQTNGNRNVQAWAVCCRIPGR